MSDDFRLSAGTNDGPTFRSKDVNGAGVKFQVVITEPHAAPIVGSTLTRPANTTTYAANDAISNNATAGSVTAISFTVSDINDSPISLEKCRVVTTDTGLKGKAIRIIFYQADPTSSSGIINGDNAAFSTKTGSPIGSMVGTFNTAFSDGAFAECVPEFGARIISKPSTGAQTVFGLYQSVDGFIPSANSTTLIPTLEVLQLRA